MPNISIHNYRNTRLTPKTERLSLNATVHGKAREIIVDIGRYEKRPVFVIRDWGELCDYQSGPMRELLNQLVMVYTNTLAASNDDSE